MSKLEMLPLATWNGIDWTHLLYHVAMLTLSHLGLLLLLLLHILTLTDDPIDDLFG